MQTMTVAQAKNQLSSLIHVVEQGEDVVLTRHGKPVVRMVAERALPAAKTPAELDAQARAILAAARSKVKGQPRFEDWKIHVESGRRF